MNIDNFNHLQVFLVLCLHCLLRWTQVLLMLNLVGNELWRTQHYLRCIVLEKIKIEEWLSQDTPSLTINNVFLHPFLMGHCSFKVETFIMYSVCKECQKAHEQHLSFWNGVPASTQKPIEWTFKIFKCRFLLLSHWITLHHKEDCSFSAKSCVILRNICIAEEEQENNYNVADLLENVNEITIKISATKKPSDALLHHLINSA